MSIIKAGVIGYPIKHSLSPRIHNFWLKHYGINGSYEAIEVAPEELEVFFTKTLLEEGYAGVNITLPYKEKVLEFAPAKQIEFLAKVIQAANTVVIKNDLLYYFNSDAEGFIKNIASSLPLNAKKAVILGAGGAARAICVALYGGKHQYVEQITIVNRTRRRAEILANEYNTIFGQDNFTVIDWEEKEHALVDADLLVNTTSLGMVGQPPLDITLGALPSNALVTDIVYNPLETRLLRQAREQGNPTVDGLGMLLHQAALGFEHWFGVKPEVTESLRHHVLEGLKQ